MTVQKSMGNKRRCHRGAYHPSHRRTWRLSPVGIVDDCIIIYSHENEDMSKFIVRFRFLFGNFNFCRFIFYLGWIWVFRFVLTSLMRLIRFVFPVSFMSSVTFLGKCWSIRDIFNVSLDTLTEQRPVIRSLANTTHDLAKLWASFRMYWVPTKTRFRAV